MREIKFRGLSKKQGWVYGSLVVTDNFVKHKPKQHTKTWIVVSAFGNGGWFNINKRVYVIPKTVGQYTGLKDKNGVEIYEGDKVSYRHYDDDEDCLFTTEIGQFGLIKGEFGEWNVWTVQFAMDSGDYVFEVIGNIHESKNESE